MGLYNWLFGSGSEKGEKPVGDHGQNEDDEDYAESFRPLKSAHVMRLAEASAGIGFPNVDAGTEFDDRFFINLEKSAPLDLPPNVQHLAQRLSLISYRKNVRAFRATETITSFAWGDGPKFKAADPNVNNLLKNHWLMNQWEKKGPERIRSLSVFGEQLYPAFTNDETGIVRISSVSPLKIKKILRDPDNAEELTAVATTVGIGVRDHHGNGDGHGHGHTDPHGDPVHGHGHGLGGKKFEIIRLRDNGKLEGEAFFFAVNRISGASRGLPDTLSSIDWLEGMDQFVFSLMERANLASNVVWDIEYQGLKTTEVRGKAQEFVKAVRNSGGAYAHNEKVKLEVKVPKLGSSDAEAVIRIILRQIQAGTGLAGMFFGDSADLTRSSASELTVPVAKMIQGRQNFIKAMLVEIFNYQIQEAIRVGKLDKNVDTSFDIEMARVYLRDLSLIATAITQIGEALLIGVDQQWISNDQAGDLYRGALEQVGPLGDGPTPNVAEGMDPELNKLADKMEKNGLINRNENGPGTPSVARGEL